LPVNELPEKQVKYDYQRGEKNADDNKEPEMPVISSSHNITGKSFKGPEILRKI
jgi:hypothetical protein